MKRIGQCRIFVMVATVVLVSLCHHPVPSGATVEIAPGVGTQVDQKVVNELESAFEQAENAVQRADLEGLMRFYQEGYNYHGLKRLDVRRVWGEVFAHYDQVTSKHMFTDIKIFQSNSAKKAYVTCTGGLYGKEKISGKPIVIDSWAGEVHFLVKENEAWKFLGNVGKAPSEVQPTSAPHHPLF